MSKYCKLQLLCKCLNYLNKNLKKKKKKKKNYFLLISPCKHICGSDQ